MAQLIDSYSESNNDYGHTMYSGWRTRTGQSFTGKKLKLSSCVFYIKKVGSPTGNAVAKLYAHSGTFGASSVPTGSALATSDNFDVATLSTSYGLITFNFTGVNKYLIDAGYWCIDCEYSGGDSSNYITIGADNSSPAHSGNSFIYDSSWTATTQDICFYVYGIPITTGGLAIGSPAMY